MDTKELENAIKPRLSQKRFIHSMNVAKCAVQLANKYGADPIKAEIAGILHDITKEVDPEKQLEILDNANVKIDKITRNAPKLLHSKSGAEIVKSELGICDEDILNAIRCHTTAKTNMTILDKVLFIADFISEERDYDGVEKMREYAEKSLDLAIYEGLAYTICDLVQSGKTVHIDTLSTYNEYASKKELKGVKPTLL